MRTSDILAEKVVKAVGELPVLDVERRTYDHEIVPTNQAGNFACLVFLFMPVQGTDDRVGPFDMIDPYAPQEQVSRLVTALHREGGRQRELLEAQLRGKIAARP